MFDWTEEEERNEKPLPTALVRKLVRARIGEFTKRGGKKS